jgi:ATP-dependent helicase STH1/SNF2
VKFYGQDLYPFLMNLKDYPDYYQLITHPIAMSHLRKRANSGHYKTVQAFRDDWKLMFNNARTYNQEGSWVYIDAEEMEKVFNATFERVLAGSGLPGAPIAGAGSASGSYESALTPMDEDERPPPARSRSAGRKQVISDEEYLTQSDDD